MSTTRMVAAQGWRYTRHGAPDKVLRQEKFRIPFDRRGPQVVVKMLAAPVHAHDKNLIQGNYGDIRPINNFPAVGGSEGVGIVEEVGSNAKLAVREGDLVWINKQNIGTWSSHVVTDAENVDVLPNRADLDIEHLACMSTFHTAWHLVHDSGVNIGAGDVILQTGASGSVSQVCMGLARARGAKLIQTMRGSRAEHNHLISRFKLMGSYAVLPYSYLNTKYMKRLLSDLPAPKLMLNSCGGHEASQLVQFLGDNGTCVTYGAMAGKPMQIANLELMRRGIEFKGFWLPKFQAAHSRESRMRVHQNVIEAMTLLSGQSTFRATRYKMDSDADFAFANAWSSPYVNRKAVLRMVGEYGEWRRPRTEIASYNMARAMWEDMLQQLYEQTSASETPGSFKYYTPFGNWHTDFHDAMQSKELGHRESFFRRPNAPRHNASEQTV